MIKQNRMIGVIGGMGPYSSAYFYKLLLKKSSDLYGAKNNSDFPEILIDSVPVPDFISNTDKLTEAKSMLIQRVKKMNDYGVENMGMVCNTAHILYKELSKVSKVEFHSMIDLVAEKAERLNLHRVCVLATPTTITFNLYGKVLSKKGVKTFYPGNEILKQHELVIRNMVGGRRNLRDIRKLEASTNRFIRKNQLDGIILGCTELPLIFPKDKFVNVIDCIDILADKLLEKYYD